MSDEQPPVRRTASQEMTAVIPRDKLPPPSKGNLDELDLDPEHPETKELYERAFAKERQEAPTMVPCPAPGCRSCPCCGGGGITTSERRSEWLKERVDQGSASIDEPT